MRGIFANRWWIVVSTICGLIVGDGAVNVFAFAREPAPAVGPLKAAA